MNEQTNTRRGSKWDPSALLWVGIGLLTILVVFLMIRIFRGPAAQQETEAPTQASTAAAAESTVPTAAKPAETEPAATESTAAEAQTQETEKDEPPETEAPASQTVELMALGDNLIHASLLEAALQDDGSYDFHDFYKYIADEVAEADIACIQQETILINDPNQYAGYPVFGSPVSVGEALIDTGFDVINHCSNHCYDKSTQGIRDSLDFWRQYPQITVLGIHDSPEDAAEIRVVESKGIRIAMLSYTYGTNMGEPKKSWEIDFLDRNKVAADMARAKEISDIVLVFTHWGAEDAHQPNSYQREWAQYIADLGAGAVIGCHTHSLQPLETITASDGRQVPVFWSMGNFVSHMLENQNHLGGMARLTIGRDDSGVCVVSSELIPTMSFGSEDSGKWEFYGMRLSDYTDELAARHFVEHTSVEEMWALYRKITGEEP